MTSRRIHPAWIVLGAVTICLLASTGLRATFAVYIKPIEAEMGWSRGALSIAAAISLLLLGASGPFAGRLAVPDDEMLPMFLEDEVHVVVVGGETNGYWRIMAAGYRGTFNVDEWR